MTRWHILTIGPTDVYLHPAMLFYGLYAMLTGHALFMGLAMASILLHEAAHALVSTLCGHPPACIELTPLGAVMRLEDEGRLPSLQRTMMLLAGPAMTLLLCFLSLRMTAGGMLPTDMGRLLFMSNLSILLLNLLPVFPLDGGRVLSLLLERFFPYRIVSRVMQCLGSIFGVGLIALNLYASWKLGGWNLSLAFAGCCLLYSAVTATTTRAMAELRYFMDRKIAHERKGSGQAVWIASLHTQTLRQLVRILPPRHIAIYVCLEAGSMNPLGWMTESELIQQYMRSPEMPFSEAVKLYPSQCLSSEPDNLSSIVRKMH